MEFLQMGAYPRILYRELVITTQLGCPDFPSPTLLSQALNEGQAISKHFYITNTAFTST